MKTIKIATEFTDTPVGRFPEDGPHSGQRFREEFLRPLLNDETEVTVDIDGLEGCGSSFLEEAFGGLVRKGYFTAAQLKKKLHVLSKDKGSRMYHDSIWKHIQDAKKEAKD